MSAPSNVITLFKEEETLWKKGPGNKDARRQLKLGVHCSCGFKGKLGELLCDIEDETVNNFWCPQCRGKGWQWS